MPGDDDLFLLFIRPLNRLGIAYMVTGSAASMAYGVPRVTLDIDLVVELTVAQTSLLATAFPPQNFYCPPREVIALEMERSTRGHFNVIHLPTGFKADFYPAGDDPLHRWAMSCRRPLDVCGDPVKLAPPEYVVVRKLEYFREGGSEKHLGDIRGMLDVSREQIDETQLENLIRERGLTEAWNRVHELRL